MHYLSRKCECGACKIALDQCFAAIIAASWTSDEFERLERLAGLMPRAGMTVQ